MKYLHPIMAKFDELQAVRYLLLGQLIFLMISTSLAVVAEILVILLFLSFPVLRNRVRIVLRQPMVIMSLVWLGVVSLGVLYSLGPQGESINILYSWRKLFLIPLAAAVFNDDTWKLKLVLTLLWTVMLAVVLSDLSWLLNVRIYKFPIGIVIHNHATQGMIFAVGAFAAAGLWRFKIPAFPAARWFLPAAVLLLSLNIVFITPGRSGYLVFLVLAGLMVFVWTKGWQKYVFSSGLVVVLGIGLFISPVARDRIMVGVKEINSYEQDQNLTSMGIRRVMWQNTWKAFLDKPLLGYGTGGFVEGYRRQVAGIPGWQGQVVADPHNQFLRIAVEYGVLGLLVFLVFLGSFLRQEVFGWARFLGLGVLVAWCATSMFSAHFASFTEGRFIYLWCGALLAYVPSTEHNAFDHLS